MSDDGINRARGGRLHLGTTRERVRCTCADGHIFTAKIHLAVDVDSDQAVLDRLTDQGLQSVCCPTCNAEQTLAEPLVLHAREGGRLALFVPDPLAHRELHLRADLMREVADADPEATPAYAAEFETLIGSRALRYWLFGPSARAQVARSSAAPQVAEPDPSEQTERTEPPAQAIEPPAERPVWIGARRSVRERGSKPMIHEAFADLMSPEQRTSSIPPEIDPDDDEDRLRDDDWLDDASLNDALSRPATPRVESRPPGERFAEPPPVAEEDEPRESETSRDPRPQVDFAGLLTEENEDDDDYLVEDEDLDTDHGFDLEDEEEVFGGALREGSSGTRPKAEERADSPDAAAEQWAGADRDFEVIGDQLILHHRVDPETAERFDPASAELWIQLHVFDGFPLVLVTLVADPSLATGARLVWPLNLRREPHREVVHTLRRSFRAEVRLTDRRRQTLSSFEVTGERELNAAVVLKRATQAFEDLPPGGPSFEAAIEAVDDLARPLGVAPPPPLHSTRLPRLGGHTELTEQLETLAEWTTGHRRDELVLVRSFPLDHLEAIVAELVGAAVELGVAIPDALADRAESIRGSKGTRRR